MRLVLLAFVALLGAPAATSVTKITDGDTVWVAPHAKVRLVQIDTPEFYGETECYGVEASAAIARLVPVGTRVRLATEPAGDDADRYGRLLRYVVRVRDGLNVNLALVAQGAAAPYFYAGERGRYATELDRLARRARARKLGLWGKCPGTPYDPYHSVDTGPPR